ncbi:MULTISPECIES: hypothetical protein [Mangrovimonas]|uniref:hypothetical protein n=1 Tax=Mangrovimonas TaxID=1211036 RepID=UPI0006B4C6B7|nr:MULTISPECIES: hypothetical protein [Mangrovimonas]OMP29845.1 hypothetical protein BKM32_14625 [Mangrovimonas sp. DI 80]
MNSDNDKKDTKVYLTVDTSKINLGNVNFTAIFSDNRDDVSYPAGVPSKFISKVDKNKSVTWEGLPKYPDSGDTVQIILVARKPGDSGGAKILKKSIIEVDSLGNVSGKIHDSDIEGEENYYVVFTVNNDTSNPYVLDPKLKMTDKI